MVHLAWDFASRYRHKDRHAASGPNTNRSHHDPDINVVICDDGQWSMVVVTKKNENVRPSLKSVCTVCFVWFPVLFINHLHILYLSNLRILHKHQPQHLTQVQ